MARRPCSVAFVGLSDGPLRALLEEVLADLGALVHGGGEDPPDVVLAAVRAHDAPAVLASARQLAGRSPVVAVLPFPDDALRRRALALGADACYAVTSRLDELRQVLRDARGGA